MKVPILFGWISTIILQNKNFYCHLRACFFSFPLSSSGSFLLLSSSGTFFFVILGYFLFCHPRTLFSPVMFGLEPDISLTDSRVKLSPPLSLPDLIRQSRDSPVEPGNDEKEKKHDNDKKKKSTGMTSK